MALLKWWMTAWETDGHGHWLQQPVIIVQGAVAPFFADHPQPYIDRLQEMHDSASFTRGAFWTCIGQLKDALEQGWETNSPAVPVDGHHEP